VLTQTQTALKAQLFKHPMFRDVPEETLASGIKQEKLNIAKISAKGWQGTKLQQTVDMIVLGSVAQDDKGYYIEVKFHAASGKLIFSQIVRASSSGNINGAAKDIVENVMERFPFEANVIAKKDDRFEVNLGDSYAMSRGTEFEVMGPAAKDGSRAAGARLVVKRVGDTSSMAEVGDNKEGEKVTVGDRVVRRVQHEGESGSGSSREYVSLLAKGADGKALAGVNVYLNNDWVGTTGTNGRVEVTIRTGKSYNLMLYRHGYQQLAEKVRAEKTGESKEYVLAANTAVFNIESTPSNATVFVDGEEIGRTPLAGKSIDLGFHSVRLSAGESYRDWEEVVEFNKKVHDLTGEKKIVLYKDYMKLGEAAEAKGDTDAAIAAYAATVKGHPDYSSAHHRLAQLYLDEKDDYDGAIREFENVLSLPENEQLVFKQYAIAYTNLGHAYYGKGDAAMNSDRNAAAQYFGKAVQNLKIAKQNTRFFPKAEYDEAYFYMALSYQKLYMLTKRANLMNDANLAWRDYFDFYPASLVGKPAFEKNRETGKKFWDQIKDN
jgi:tetratricopeptide (TPR) repeat protein